MQLRYLDDLKIECGCDEAGRGCLAGPVFAAAVVLPPDFKNEDINDSKKLSPLKRNALREIIEQEAYAYAVASVSPEEIDEINILRASFLAMHRAIEQLPILPERLLIDGNRFDPYPDIEHFCVIKGDAKLMPIAAASILAKTYRDEYMIDMAQKYPNYGWDRNMGYPTKEHKLAIKEHGFTPIHRRTFKASL
ncbi:ribonuclease HII [Falsiporphyromonas endometrii]|uniref:Ribonuclease HII n=1 Tax=Falsiporphyromonas endometrii TaxID=1387297 RepID=A0ABV9K6N4_9PORP